MGALEPGNTDETLVYLRRCVSVIPDTALQLVRTSDAAESSDGTLYCREAKPWIALVGRVYTGACPSLPFMAVESFAQLPFGGGTDLQAGWQQSLVESNVVVPLRDDLATLIERPAAEVPESGVVVSVNLSRHLVQRL